jgi:hypothetical protein
MTIWLLVLLLMASLAALGYRQGGIRVAVSLIGILVGAALAGPCSPPIKHMMMVFGVKNPVLIWLLAPLIVFIIISAISKACALPLHQKVDVYYKYKAGDLRLALWERLNHRLGACLGLINGLLYALLVAAVIYPLSYWTVQTANPDTDPSSVQWVNRFGRDMHSTGFDRAARALDPMKPVFYETADIVGLLYSNPLLEARLSRYPGFLSLAERPEIQDIANDKEFTEMRQRKEPIMNVIDYPKTQGIIQNADLLEVLWSNAVPDLKDLSVYFETGRSPKYESVKILSRWDFDVNATIGLRRKANPNISSIQMKQIKQWMSVAFAKTSIVAGPDHLAVIKNLPPLKVPVPNQPPPPPETWQGQWKDLDEGKYALSFPANNQEVAAVVEGDRLTVSLPGFGLVFSRED